MNEKHQWHSATQSNYGEGEYQILSQTRVLPWFQLTKNNIQHSVTTGKQEVDKQPRQLSQTPEKSWWRGCKFNLKLPAQMVP